MKRRLRGAVSAAVAACALALPAWAQTPAAAAPPIGELKSLGQDRYQVGRVVIDKRAHTVTVPGRMLVLDAPLEYLATSPGGRRAYESLLELDTSGTELNLACILVGLERDADVPPWMPLGAAGRTGARVELTLAWTEGARPRRMSAAEALLGPEAMAKGGNVEWAYAGSFTPKDSGELAADVTGSLISFVKKDRSGILEAVSEASLGPYGTVRGHPALPPSGTAVDLVIQAAPPKR